MDPPSPSPDLPYHPLNSEIFYRTFGEAVPDFAWACGVQGEPLYVNPRWTDYTGLTLETAATMPLDVLHHPEDYPHLIAAWQDASARGETFEAEFRYRRKDGVYRWFHVRAVPVKDDAGRIVQWIGTSTDIHERKRMEVDLLQAQKLESVGRLAGGVAHDFNNLLTVISGYAEFIQRQLPPEAPQQKGLLQIRSAAERAANLTHQLLAFARQQVIEPRVIQLNDLILNLDTMLRRLIGEDIELTTRTTPGLSPILADPGQIEQILVNLALNARDAMPHGGRLTIETAPVLLETDDTRRHPEILPGPYTLFSVSDTGMGMEESVQQHIFEPFFTTKEKGRGTGLGLATCYGIVKQAGGHIQLDSEPGHGTTFKIYLPCVRDRAEAPLETPSAERSRGTETILLVEDEMPVLTLAATVLRHQGYTVLEASNGQAALEMAHGHVGEIHLLLTDVVMPQMGGKALVALLRAEHPRMKVLYTSGYTDDAIVHHGILKAGVAFLQKPFTPTSLANKVRTTLDTPI